MDLYRFEDSIGDQPFSLPGFKISKFRVVRTTPKGYWVRLFEGFSDMKWVPKEGRNLFAFDCKAEALKNYIARKNRQLEMLSRRVVHTRTRINLACTTDPKKF